MRRLRYMLNPCDVERFGLLAPIGDAAAAIWHFFTAGTDCPCCLGFRLMALVAFTLAATSGYFLL